MPSAILPTISADEIDDLLFLARTNDIQDLKAGIEAIARTQQTSSEDVILATIDPDNGNGLLHYASANGCLGTYFPPHTNRSGYSHQIRVIIRFLNSVG